MFKREKLNDDKEKEEELMPKIERMENQLENIAYKTDQYRKRSYIISTTLSTYTPRLLYIQGGYARNIFFIVGHQLHQLQSVPQLGEGHTLTVQFDFQLLYAQICGPY